MKNREGNQKSWRRCERTGSSLGSIRSLRAGAGVGSPRSETRSRDFQPTGQVEELRGAARSLGATVKQCAEKVLDRQLVTGVVVVALHGRT